VGCAGGPGEGGGGGGEGEPVPETHVGSSVFGPSTSWNMLQVLPPYHVHALQLLFFEHKAQHASAVDAKTPSPMRPARFLKHVRFHRAEAVHSKPAIV
jgi:hypothetical protein